MEFARAYAVRVRIPEPAGIQDALMPPLSQLWAEALTPLRDYFLTNRSLACKLALEALAGGAWEEKLREG